MILMLEQERWEGGEDERERKDERREKENRKSRGKKVNKERRYLTVRLEEIGWFIFNGCGKGNEERAWTYAGDYVLGDGHA